MIHQLQFPHSALRIPHSAFDSLSLWLAWRRLGRPVRGGVFVHGRNTYPFEEGAGLAARLEKAFGGLSALSCIDLGCGPAQTPIAREVLAIPWRRLVSVEAFLPYARKLREKTPAARRHDIREIRIERIFEEFPAGEIDLALLIDVLEHFPRRSALGLLTRLEGFVKRGIVIFSPVGPVAQEELDGNALQRHRSFWQPEDWARLGYQVELYEAFHGLLIPPADAAWAIKRIEGKK